MLNTIGGFDCVYPHTRYHVMTCYDFVVVLSLTHFRAAQYNFDVVIEKCEALIRTIFCEFILLYCNYKSYAVSVSSFDKTE